MSDLQKYSRQVSRTREMLRSALMTLILEKGYESITIQDIVDRANLGRATFYTHFRDKEDLLLTSMKEGYQQLLARLEAERSSPDELLSIEMVFEYAAANRELFLVILYGAGKTVIYQQARDFIAEQAKKQLQGRFGDPAIPLDLAAMYFAGSLLSILVWWLEQGMPYTAAEMAAMLQILFRRASGIALDGH